MRISDVFNECNPDSSKIEIPYIIAEIGVNHEGNMDIAKRLIDEAQEGGAHAVKFQTYKADTIASKNSPSYWDLTKEKTTSQHKLFKKYDKFWKTEFEELRKYCDHADIEFLSTPFDLESATFLNDLMDVFKISSSDITNKPFIEYICQFGKPIILSTGAANMDEILSAVGWIQVKKNTLSLLHCILNYPTLDENANLGMIMHLKEKFPQIIIGYSDHTLPKEMDTLVTSMMLGAKIVEKHFTHDKSLPGNDHYHAMDKNDLQLFISKANEIIKLIGSYKKKSLDTEELARLNARRSLVAKKQIEQGSIITEEDLTFKRPAHGIPPYNFEDLIGKRAKVEILQDTILTWDMIY